MKPFRVLRLPFLAAPDSLLFQKTRSPPLSVSLLPYPDHRHPTVGPGILYNFDSKIPVFNRLEKLAIVAKEPALLEVESGINL